MKNPNAYALLIGIGDYPQYDPSGASDLKGPPNDVASWLNTAIGLGIPRENIRICVSPGMPDYIDPAHLDGIHITGASRAEVLDGLAGLAKALDGEAGTKAVLTWSGHGTRTAEGLVLCPSDISVDGDTLVGGITTQAVGEILARRAPRTRLTAFVDTCHDSTGFEDSVGTARSRGLAWPGEAALPAAAPATDTHHEFGDLVVTSSQPGTVSYDMPVLGGVRGAFSWAASNVIRRYGLVEGVAGQTSGLTFEALTETCARILEGMLVKQKPRFVGAEAAGHQRVFSAFGDDAGVSTPRDLPGHEIWPGMAGQVLKSELYDSGGTRLGTMYLTSSSPPSGWTSNQQYWVWNTSAVGYDWPTVTFEAQAPSPTSDSPPTAYVWIYKTSALTAQKGTSIFQGPSYGVSTSQTGGTIGYLRKHDDHLTVYSTQSSAPSYLSSSYVALWFVYTTSTITTTTYASTHDNQVN